MSRIYLIAALPKLSIGVPLELTRSELNFAIEQNLSKPDRLLIDDVRRIADIANAACWLQGRPLSHEGTISPKELRVFLEQEDEANLPSLVIEYLSLYPDKNERKKHADKLVFSYLHRALCLDKTNSYSSWTAHRPNKTVAAIYELEHLSRLLLAHMREKEKHHHSSDSEKTSYQQEVQVLEDSLGFSFDAVEEWPELYRPLHKIWNEHKDTPKDLEEALFEWRFKALDGLISPLNHFGIEHILVYCIQFDLLEYRSKMNSIACNSVIERISKASR